MLAIADKHGEVHASIPGLAQVAGMPLSDTEAAINKFLAPDKYSRTPDDEGRRIEKIDGGWLLLNHAKYRAMASKDEEKSSAAKRQAAFRERQKRNGRVTARNDQVTVANCVITVNTDIAEAEAEAEAKETSIPATPPPAIPPAAPPGDIVEKAPDSRHSAFIKAYSEAYEIETGSKYIFQPREAKTLQTFLTRCPATVDQMLTMLRWAWNRSKEPFASKHHSAATIQDFLTDWQKLVMDRSQQRAGKDGQPKKPKHSSCL